MTKPLRIGTAMTAVGLVIALAACSNPTTKTRTASIFGGKVDNGNIGLATRAQAALLKNDLVTAVRLAEGAVANSPRDAGFRALLGNVYFASGRFASAETAYRDSIALVPNQPQVYLKAALAATAQGRSSEALALLDVARSVLDPSDYGLALVLAGQAQNAVAVLDQAARSAGADSRVRQNLALAYAFAGDWTAARNVAAQDLQGDQLESRMQQWMSLTKPSAPGQQVAALIGIAPASSDPGQPTRLALSRDDTQTRLADVAPTPPAPVADVAAPVAVAVAEPLPEVVPTADPVAAPAVVAEAAPIAPAPVYAQADLPPPRPSLSPRAASLTADVPQLRRAVAVRATARRSQTVVQLGAYSSRQRIAQAWSKVAGKFGALRGYSPMSARYDSPTGPVYRLSVHGFASAREAASLCGSLKKAGSNCFVRTVAGDAPVQFASR